MPSRERREQARGGAAGRGELMAAVARCRGHFLSAALFSVFVNLLALTGPLFMLQVYDRVLASRSVETLAALTLLVTGLFAMLGLLEFVRGRVLARAGARIQHLLDARAMTAALHRALTPSERARPATAAQDLEAVRQALSGPAPFAVFDMPWTPLFLGVIFLFHPLLGWVAVGGGVLLLALAAANQLRSQAPAAAAQEAGDRAQSLGEALRQNTESMHALGMRGSGLKRWLGLRGEALGQQISASDRTGAYMAASKALRFYLQVLILAAGAWLVIRHEISAGVMIAASIMLGRALAPVEQAIGQWGTVQRAGRGWRALGDLLASVPPEGVRTTLPAPRGVVHVHGLTVVAPDGGPPLIRNVGFRVEPGQALGVIGPSGSGKTTLARVLAGIWRPAAGKVRLDGAALEQWDGDALGRHLGYLPQDTALIDGTVAENVARLARVRDDAEVVAAARRAGAHEAVLALPQGYETEVGAGGQRLSGGQRQRVALARALYGDPTLLVLDEPNANLDARGEQALIAAIRDAKARGRTVIVMAHRPGAIAACDLLLMLDDGAQVDFGPRDDVLRRRTRNYPQLVKAPEGPRSAAAGPSEADGGAGGRGATA